MWGDGGFPFSAKDMVAALGTALRALNVGIQEMPFLGAGLPYICWGWDFLLYFLFGESTNSTQGFLLALDSGITADPELGEPNGMPEIDCL